ncbi:glycosyltransferase family 2 protein [Thermodesulfobacteriota bacterium]
MKVAIIILNFFGWRDTIECLESLQKNDYRQFTMIVVDNGSKDGSIEKICEWASGKFKIDSEFIDYEDKFKPINTKILETQGLHINEQNNFDDNFFSQLPNRHLLIIKSSKNLGFSGGNNLGAKYAFRKGFDYIVLLNNDTIIVDRDFIKKLINVFPSNKSCKVVGPKIINLDGSFDGPYIYESYLDELFLLPIKNQLRKILGCNQVYIDMKAISSAIPVPVYKISGACMAFEANFLDQIDYLDENVWLSCEEAIVAEKVLTEGKKIYYQPLTTLIHKKAQSPRPKNTRTSILRNHFKQRRYFLSTYRKYGKLKILPIRIMHEVRLLIERIKFT